MLQLTNVKIKTDDQILVDDLNLTVEPGSAAVIMGKSGTGKSTLLSWMIGLPQPHTQSSGAIVLNGANITDCPTNRRHVGILFQDDSLFPHMSIMDNMLFATPPGGGRTRRRKYVLDYLSTVRLDVYAGRFPHELSGGERSRLSLMRTLIAEPKAILLDEPFSGLDADTRREIRRWVYDQIKQRDIPVVMVTHDKEDIPLDNYTLTNIDRL